MSPITIETLSPEKLSEKDLRDIHELTQDLWGDGLAELIRCRECSRISGKKEVFYELPLELYRETVSHILSQRKNIQLSCPHCGSHQVRLIFGEENFKNIEKRLFRSSGSTVSLCRTRVGEIIGYAEVYRGEFELIYELELRHHYAHIPIDTFRKAISHILSNRNITASIALSSIGISGKYRSGHLLMRMLRHFSHHTHLSSVTEAWIMELDAGSPMYRLFEHMWLISLNKVFPEIFQWRNAAQSYKSHIWLLPSPIESLRDYFKKHATEKGVWW
jgi:hypothetical protein